MRLAAATLPLPPLSLLLLTLLTVAVYWPGLAGGFLFDDYPNLDDMGNYGGVVDWDSFRAFVFSGWSGPTGRPVSLASFLLDDVHVAIFDAIKAKI